MSASGAPRSRGAFLFSGSDLLLPVAPDLARPLWVPEAEAGGALASLESSGSLPPGYPLRRDFDRSRASWAALGLPPGLAPPGFAAVPIRGLLAERTETELRPALHALALLNWIGGARFCGACAAPLEDLPAEHEHAGGRRCPACGRLAFPKISPAVIVLVRKEGKVLLAHNARFPGGRFGLVAGFVEVGETLEEAARRELREEAGIEVEGLTYRYSQPWPFPDSLMLAFTAEWASGEARPDGVELDELRWCGREDLPTIPPPGSVARRLIDDYL